MKGRISPLVVIILAAHLFGGCSGKMDTPNGSDVFFTGKSTRAEVAGDFGKLPLSFEVNRGQSDERVRFIARGKGFRAYLTPDEVVMVVAARAGPEDGRGAGSSAAKGRVSRSRYAVGMQFAGAGISRRISGGRLLPGKSSYIIGNDPDKWLTGIPNYERVIYRELYPGVDLEIFGSRDGIEYDFVIRPGFDPGAIGLTFSGAREAVIDESGNLVITTGAGEVIHHAPRLYQSNADGRREAAGRFAKREDGTFGFAVSSYDTGNALVIDPEITFGTYLGGANLDEALGLAVDSDGNAYLAGRTFSDDFPVTAGAHDVECGSDGFCDDSGLISDIFVAKLSSSGTELLYATYIGGSGDDSAAGIAINDAGNAYVAGRTESTDFPLLDPFRFNLSGSSDAFILVLNPTGSLLRYSTYFGGSGDDEALAVAVSSGDAFVAGSTGSTDFHTNNPLQIDFGGGVTDGFVARFDIDIFLGTGLPTYSTYIGGSEEDSVKGLAVDTSGDIYVTGMTNSDDFPTKNPITDVGGDSRSGGEDAFAAKIDPSFVGIAALVYATYLGGTGIDSGSAVGVDSSGNAYVTGRTFSSDFPVKATFQDVRGGSFDAFVSKISSTGSTLTYSTYLGGSGSDEATAIAVTGSGLAYVTGRTASSNFPVVEPIEATSLGSDDLFLSKLRTPGSSLEYSTYLGGSSTDWGTGVALQGSDNVFVAGYTSSDDFPVLDGFDEEFRGNRDAFVLKILENRSIQRFDVVEGCGVSGPGEGVADYIGAFGLLILVTFRVMAKRWRRK